MIKVAKILIQIGVLLGAFLAFYCYVLWRFELITGKNISTSTNIEKFLARIVSIAIFSFAGLGVFVIETVIK